MRKDHEHSRTVLRSTFGRRRGYAASLGLLASRARSQAVAITLDDWRIAAVLRAVAEELRRRVKDMPRELRERFEAHWPSWSGLFRMARNEAGHPSSVEPVTHEQVHAALLMFHEQARLCRDLSAWIDSSF